MNWTAILALVLANILAWLEVRNARRQVDRSVEDVVDARRDAANVMSQDKYRVEQITELRGLLKDAERRARRRERTSDSHPSGPRTGETDA